jgi:hypothetical protein
VSFTIEQPDLAREKQNLKNAHDIGRSRLDRILSQSPLRLDVQSKPLDRVEHARVRYEGPTCAFDLQEFGHAGTTFVGIDE